jgi:hypothetical protein
MMKNKGTCVFDRGPYSYDAKAKKWEQPTKFATGKGVLLRTTTPCMTG